jgi:hypothetical protein
MEQIEFVEFGNFGHARGESQIVGRKLEERIAGDRNLVIEDALFAAVETEGLRVGDEVHLVTECRQFNAQFGGYDARSTVRGVTRDSDPHRGFLNLFCWDEFQLV